MSGAVIVDRASSETSDRFADALSKCMASDLDIMICVVSSPAPLGAPDTPPEQHPFCAPNAPGKDRMTIPAADPFSAPLNEVHIFEICRHRFLATARSVANIDVYEMIRGRKSIFVYRQTMEYYLIERGQNDRAARFVETFRRLRNQ